MYFDMEFQRLVRYDFQTFGGDQENVGVTTDLFNVVTGNESLIPASVFAGSGACGPSTTPRPAGFFSLA